MEKENNDRAMLYNFYKKSRDLIEARTGNWPTSSPAISSGKHSDDEMQISIRTLELPPLETPLQFPSLNSLPTADMSISSLQDPSTSLTDSSVDSFQFTNFKANRVTSEKLYPTRKMQKKKIIIIDEEEDRKRKRAENKINNRQKKMKTSNVVQEVPYDDTDEELFSDNEFSCHACLGDEDWNIDTAWLACSNECCKHWFHKSCISYNVVQMSNGELEEFKFFCKTCIKKNMK